jgi:hypothetical protein
MCGTLISPQLHVQLSSHWTVFAHHPTVHQTPTYSIPVLASSFTQQIILVCAIPPFEFTSCFGLTNQLRYCLAQHVNWYALDSGIPALTLAWIINHILERLELVCGSNAKSSHQTNLLPPLCTSWPLSVE